MPDSMHMIDAGLPRWNGSESTEEKVSAIQNYLFMLLEELRYLLRHLGKDNFTQAGAQEVVEQAFGGDGSGTGETNNYFETLISEIILANTILSNTVVTNELYANYGDIADLTVWKLRTDYLRAQNYLHGSRADVNYISIHEEQIDFITASVASPLRTEQLSRDGRPYYWTDESRTRMTCMEATPWPVTVYVYDELTKMSVRFQELMTTQGTTTYGPVIVLGAGDGQGNSKGYIFKEQNDLLIRYVTSGVEETDIALSDFVDAKHRRLASCTIDTGNGTVDYTVEGSEEEYGLTFTVDGDTVTYTWPDGHECVVNVV
ncbi:MAG: hypothetical protein IKO91_05255 [Oscillospiraceae bacterium]|nr:hypothetical protein [Oscillospiraceae bacterium]